MCDLSALVVASDKRDAVGIANLQSEKQQKRFNRVKASINKIAHEKVIGVRTLASNFEELQQVKKLTMNVAANGYGAVHALHVALLTQNLARLGAQQLHLALFDVLASLELLDPFVHVGGAAHGAQALERTL